MGWLDNDVLRKKRSEVEEAERLAQEELKRPFRESLILFEQSRIVFNDPIQSLLKDLCEDFARLDRLEYKIDVISYLSVLGGNSDYSNYDQTSTFKAWLADDSMRLSSNDVRNFVDITFHVEWKAQILKVKAIVFAINVVFGANGGIRSMTFSSLDISHEIHYHRSIELPAQNSPEYVAIVIDATKAKIQEVIVRQELSIKSFTRQSFFSPPEESFWLQGRQQQLFLTTRPRPKK